MHGGCIILLKFYVKISHENCAVYICINEKCHLDLNPWAIQQLMALIQYQVLQKDLECMYSCFQVYTYDGVFAMN